MSSATCAGSVANGSTTSRSMAPGESADPWKSAITLPERAGRVVTEHVGHVDLGHLNGLSPEARGEDGAEDPRRPSSARLTSGMERARANGPAFEPKQDHRRVSPRTAMRHSTSTTDWNAEPQDQFSDLHDISCKVQVFPSGSLNSAYFTP
jgi:hypothetical protein